MREQRTSIKLKNIWKHFYTITSHKYMVAKYCFMAGISLQGLKHDLSKYSREEFWVGVRYYQGHRSPNEGEREAYGYSRAWIHHKGRNKHHFEYWTDYNPQTKKISPVKMPLKYVIEMFCDRVAAGKIYQKEKYKDSSPLEYFERGRTGRLLHPETSDLLEELLIMLAEKGEAKTFAYIRQLKKREK